MDLSIYRVHHHIITFQHSACMIGVYMRLKTTSNPGGFGFAEAGRRSRIFKNNRPMLPQVELEMHHENSVSADQTVWESWMIKCWSKNLQRATRQKKGRVTTVTTRVTINTHDGSMSMNGIYLPTWMAVFCFHIGKYTSPMDPMGIVTRPTNVLFKQKIQLFRRRVVIKNEAPRIPSLKLTASLPLKVWMGMEDRISCTGKTRQKKVSGF